ncbi:MAG TPA: SDR family oxidoreductase [Anaerolineales bacterium]|nr:SDR family oxidoreductase [Anaerolineales bacterium]
MKRILITGASGLLGINLALTAAQQSRAQDGSKYEVYGTVNQQALRTDAFTVIQTDLLASGALERLLEQTRPDWVIHCAALAELEACEADPEKARQLNSVLPEKLAVIVARGGARLVHVSTDAVFDGQRGDYTEADAPNPLSIYARTKLEGERAVSQANPEAIIARVNLFGWSLSGKRSLAEFFYNNLSAGRRVMGFTDVFFCPLLANDLAALFFQMLEKELHGLYHVVSQDCTSKYDFGVRIARKFGLEEGLIAPTSVERAGLKATRSPKLTLRSEKLAQALGAPPPDLSTALDRFYTLYQQGYPQFLQKMAAQE